MTLELKFDMEIKQTAIYLLLSGRWWAVFSLKHLKCANNLPALGTGFWKFHCWLSYVRLPVHAVFPLCLLNKNRLSRGRKQPCPPADYKSEYIFKCDNQTKFRISFSGRIIIFSGQTNRVKPFLGVKSEWIITQCSIIKDKYHWAFPSCEKSVLFWIEKSCIPLSWYHQYKEVRVLNVVTIRSYMRPVKASRELNITARWLKYNREKINHLSSVVQVIY